MPCRMMEVPRATSELLKLDENQAVQLKSVDKQLISTRWNEANEEEHRKRGHNSRVSYYASATKS